MKQAVLKAPNDILTPDDELIEYERGVVASYKVDGNRCMCVCGELFSSSWKNPRNTVLQKMLAPLRQYCIDHQAVLDFEIFSHNVSQSGHHAQLSGFVNSYHNPAPADLIFYVFDGAPFGEWMNDCLRMPYLERISFYHDAVEKIKQEEVIAAQQFDVQHPDHMHYLYKEALLLKYEGLMIRHTNIWRTKNRMRGGFWKHGRATLNQAVMFKMKNYVTIDGYILNVLQRRMLKDTWPRKHDQNGNLIRPLEKDAYTTTDMVGAFVIEVPGNPPLITEIGFGKGFDHDWRRKVWHQFVQNRNLYVGRWVEVMHMPHGAMEGGRLRGGRLIRFRDDIKRKTLVHTGSYDDS